MTQLISSLDAHKHLPATMTACSVQHGWRSLLLRGFMDPPTVEEFKTPATADHLIVLVTSGRVNIEVRYRNQWQRSHFEPGHIGMTAPGEEVALRWRGDTSHGTLQLHLPANALQTLLQDFSDRDPTLFRLPSSLMCGDPVIQHAMLGLAGAMHAGAPDLYAETARDFLIAHLLIRHAGLKEPQPANPARRRLRLVDDFLRAHLDKPLSLEDISREAGLSRFHTLRLFKSAFGETPMRRLVRLRVERAKSYLARGNEPVTEIAFRCGYENPAHFAVAFRRWVGMSPSDYRRRNTQVAEG